MPEGDREERLPFLKHLNPSIMPTNKQTPPAANELFTPGEWYSNDIVIMRKDYPKHIGQAFVIKNFDSLQWKEVIDAEANANASLMAAAPDLYYALKEVLEWGKNKDGKFTYVSSSEHRDELIEIMKKANPNYKP